jgi:hypothetical protein
MIKEEWTINEVLKENLLELSRAELLAHCTRSTDIKMSNEGYQATIDGIVGASGDIRRLKIPWAKIQESKSPRANIRSMAAAWREVWGDPNDPLVAAAIDNTIKVLLKEK